MRPLYISFFVLFATLILVTSKYFGISKSYMIKLKYKGKLDIKYLE